MAIKDHSAESMAVPTEIHMCLLLMLICQCCPVAGSRGREFYVVFMEVRWSVSDSGLSPFLTIINPNEAAVQVHVRYLGFPSQPSDSTLTVASSAVLYINRTVILFGAVKHTKCLHLTSTDDVYLHSSVEYKASRQWSLTGFMCLPTSALTSEYVVATHCVTRRCVLVVTSAEDGNHVQISLRVGAGENQASYRGKYYKDNEKIVESLNVGESMQVTCYTCDLTGSWVNATKKVAVFGGGRWTKGEPDRSTWDAVAEQMMPVGALGRRYVLGVKQPPLRADVKVVLLHDGDYVTKDGINYTASRDRDVKVFHEEDFNRSVEITGSAPMLVAEVVYGHGIDDPDISMNLPPPSSLWTTGYLVYLFDNVTNTICIVQPNSGPDPRVVVVGSSNLTNESISSGEYRLTTVTIHEGAGTAEVRCTDPGCRPFWAFVIQSAQFQAASHVLPPLWTLSGTQTTGGVPEATSPTTVETPAKAAPPVTTAFTTAPVTTSLTTTPMTSALTSAPMTSALTTTPLTSALTTAPMTSALTTTPVTIAKTTTPLTIAKTTTLKTTENDIASLSQTTTIAAESSTSIDVSHRTEISATPEQSTTADGIKTTADIPTTNDVTPEKDVTPIQSDVTSQSSVFTRSPCGCSCVKNVAAFPVPPEERERIMEEAKAAIKSALLTDKKKVSAYVRSKRSASDRRVSSTVVGSSIGITCFAIVFGFLVGTDMVNLIRFVMDGHQR